MQCVSSHGICFLNKPTFHPIMKPKSEISPLCSCLCFSSCRVLNSPWFSSGWMKRWMSFWGPAEQQEAFRPLKREWRPSVCLSVCRVTSGDQEEPEKHWDVKKKRDTQKNSSLDLIGSAFFRVVAAAGSGSNRPRPLLHSSSPAHRLEAQLAKIIHQSAQNGLNWSYSVVYTCDKKNVKSAIKPANV